MALWLTITIGLLFGSLVLTYLPMPGEDIATVPEIVARVGRQVHQDLMEA